MSRAPSGLTTREHRRQAADGWPLDVLEVRSAAPARACVVAGHAMMVDRRTLWRPDRPSLVGELAERGCRVLVPDLRGRGESGSTPAQGGDWTYDDLVGDTAVYLTLARELEPAAPLFVVGHSLTGHTTLAFLGRCPDDSVSRAVAGVVAMAVSLWLPTLEPSGRRRLTRRLILETVGMVSAVVGYVPARRLGFGTADESRGYWQDFRRFLRTGSWCARDGFDYAAALAHVTCPVLWVVSEGDRLAPPALSLRLGRRLPRWRALRVGRDSVGADVVVTEPPDHLPLVTALASRPVWRAVADWILERAAATTPSAAREPEVEP